MILTGEKETLNFTIKPGEMRTVRNKFFCLTQKITGFVQGEIKVMLACPSQPVPSETLVAEHTMQA